MALGIDDVVEGVAAPAVLVGVGLAAAAPFLLASSRPVAKRLIHGCLDLAERVKEMGAETREQWSDLLAEVQAERQARAEKREAAAEEPGHNGSAAGEQKKQETS